MWLIKLLQQLLDGLKRPTNDGATDDGSPPSDDPIIVGPAPTEPTLMPPVSTQPPAVDDLDRPGRFLFIDIYSLDIGGKPNWPALRERVLPGLEKFDFVGGILKASEGYAWGVSNEAWFKRNWAAMRDLNPQRNGVDFWRGAYHFLLMLQDGKRQADYYLRMVDAAGGWDNGCFLPCVDVELGGEQHPNQKATKQQIVDCTSQWAERVRSVTGRRIMLYGNGAMRDKGITERMGCDVLWIPRYTPTLPPEIYERAGWDMDSVVAWQYGGDGYAVLQGYPKSVPGFGDVDLSVCIDGIKPVTLRSIKRRMT